MKSRDGQIFRKRILIVRAMKNARGLVALIAVVLTDAANSHFVRLADRWCSLTKTIPD